MTYFQAYLLTRLDSFIGLGVSLLVIGIIISIVILIGFASIYTDDEKTEYWKTIKKVWKYSFSAIALGIIIVVGVPSTKEAAFIYIVPSIANNQDVQKTLGAIPELSSLGLEYLKEILKSEIKGKIIKTGQDLGSQPTNLKD